MVNHVKLVPIRCHAHHLGSVSVQVIESQDRFMDLRTIEVTTTSEDDSDPWHDETPATQTR